MMFLSCSKAYANFVIYSIARMVYRLCYKWYNKRVKYITLNTGAKMPVVGLGTWKAAPTEVGAAVEHAMFSCGYSHVDCAAIYRNEKEKRKL